MTSEKKTKGELAENIASSYLTASGYTILDRNWRIGRAEIDIIAKELDTLVIVEVKSRSYILFGYPEESVSSHKENLLADAAGQYMEQNNFDWEVRFDIISVIFNKDGSHQLKHYKDAFFPGMN